MVIIFVNVNNRKDWDHNMQNRLALVVGNSNYKSSPLKNPMNDARDISEKLESYGFQTMTLTDCKLEDLEDAIEDFKEGLNKVDVGLFFFAGHGIQIDNSNYLIMINTISNTEAKAKRSSMPLDDVLKAMDNSTAATKIVILDACRSNPWKRGWSRDTGNEGLASVYAPKGTIIGYATSPGEVADDGSGRNGLYTSALLNQIGVIDRPIEAIFKRVRGEVSAASNGEQTTWEHTSLSGEFYFNTSVSKAIGDYDASAFSDEIFDPEPGSFADKTIKALKSYNWYKQNPAIQSLSLATLGQLNPDELFVIGRNIMQAAHGGSSAAMAFIDDIRDKVDPWSEVKAKAVIDGILFEMFFDNEGKPRISPKGVKYLDHFAKFRNVPNIKSSLDFITKCLREASVSMFVYPNQNNVIAVTITTESFEGAVTANGVWVNSKNILKDINESKMRGLPIGTDSIKQKLSNELMIPLRQIEVSYQPNLEGDKISYPYPIEFELN